MPFAIYALSLAAFAIGTAEFIIAGILPPVAADLNVTIPTAGLLVTAYAIGVAIGGPLLTIFTARFSQRTVLIGVMSVFSVAQVLCALAPDYNMLLLARLLSSCGHGVFFGAGRVVVAQLVPVERRGKAFSLFVGGITIANLLGLPAGTAIAVQFGWRATFLAVAALGALAALVIILKLPRLEKSQGERTTLTQQVKALRHQEVWLSYVTIALTMVGTICYSTFSVPLMIQVTGIHPEIVPWVLLLGGVGSVLGIWMGGELADWKPMPSLVAVLVAQSLVFFVMLFTLHDPIAMTVTVFASGIVGFAFSTPLQSRIVHAAREAPNFAASLISTAFNIGIAAGAFLGAMLLNAGVSYADLPAAPVASALLGAATAGLSWYLERRTARLSPARP
jgi:MFS transporter, DHA1 family, inner membrane transport protein